MLFNTERLRCGMIATAAAEAGPMLFYTEGSQCRMTAVVLRTEYRREPSQYRIAAAVSVENVSSFFQTKSQCT